tara:strand:- start:28 stop:225 length:198 start_codon:yes stop_codon:yes gene_type:complete
MIIEPGQHWHKDDMPDEEPIPGVTEPNYDEHPDDDCFNCPGKSSVNCCENRNIGDLDPQGDDVPF